MRKDYSTEFAEKKLNEMICYLREVSSLHKSIISINNDISNLYQKYPQKALLDLDRIAPYEKEQRTRVDYIFGLIKITRTYDKTNEDIRHRNKEIVEPKRQDLIEQNHKIESINKKQEIKLYEERDKLSKYVLELENKKENYIKQYEYDAEMLSLYDDFSKLDILKKSGYLEDTEQNHLFQLKYHIQKNPDIISFSALQREYLYFLMELYKITKLNEIDKQLIALKENQMTIKYEMNYLTESLKNVSDKNMELERMFNRYTTYTNDKFDTVFRSIRKNTNMNEKIQSDINYLNSQISH